jgi:hypothetical protein
MWSDPGRVAVYVVYPGYFRPEAEGRYRPFPPGIPARSQERLPLPAHPCLPRCLSFLSVPRAREVLFP